MESQSETTQTVSTLKLLILKTGDYDLWSTRMKQYLTHTDYALWEVIVNVDAPAVASAMMLEAKSTMLLAIPDEHLLKFRGIKDAKTLWEAIKTRFGGNKESKKMQKTILKQQYENFAALRSEGLDKIYDSPQLDNKDPEQIDTDDLEEMDLKWQVAILTIRVKRFINKIGRNLKFYGKETIGFDKTNVECYNCHRRCHFARECRALRNQGNRNGDNTKKVVLVETLANALVVQDGMGSSSSSSSDTEVHTCSKECLQSYQSLQKQYDQQRKVLNKANLEIIGYQMGLESLEARIVVQEWNERLLKIKLVLGYDDQNDIERALNMKNSEVVHSVFNSRESDVDDNPVNERFKTGEGFHAVPPPYTRNYMPPRPDLSFAGLDETVFMSTVRKTTTIVPETLENTHRQAEYPRKSQSPRSNRRNWNGMMTRKLGNVLTKSGQVPVNAAKQSSPRAAVSVSAARRVNTAVINQKVYTAKVNNVTTAGPKAVVSAAKGNKENAVKFSTSGFWRQKENFLEGVRGGSTAKGDKEVTRLNLMAKVVMEVLGRLLGECCGSSGGIEWRWHLYCSDEGGRNKTILHMLCILDSFLDILGEGVKMVVFFLDLFPSHEWSVCDSGLELLGGRSFKEVNWDCLDRGNDSLDEMSMKSVRGIFLGGFWVEELALEAIVFKEWDKRMVVVAVIDM
ncbi:ribonuclease H-like domain-containing protein [Tanacetum coccineum]